MNREKKMNAFHSYRLSGVRWMLALAFLILPQIVLAQWQAVVGAQRNAMGHQALAFLPNEIWIHAGDSVTWTFSVDEIHTVSFLTAGQIREPFQVGCPGFTTGTATFDGSTCVTTPPLTKGQTFTVTFPTAGNFKLVCLVHQNMTGVVHVLDMSLPLPHDQHFYDLLASKELNALLSDVPEDLKRKPGAAHNAVTAGTGEIVATGGGSQTASVMRFMDPIKVLHAGDTLEWTNFDAVTPHTITFGVEPVNPVPPVNATPDPDGALHGTVNSHADNVHSGFIGAAPQDQTLLPTQPLRVTRFRVTFPRAGVFPYKCALHDNLGMKGLVIVLP
jgi:plastocyanin